MTGAELVLLLGLVQQAIVAGKDVYDASQLKALADLAVKLQAQLIQTATDRATANKDITDRDNQLQIDLDAASKKTP